jgi:hypothetical protein
MEATTFYIYEIPGIKNGATKEWQKRSQENFEKYNITPVLIETLVYPDTPEYWQIVGDREFELADMNEYSKGTHYRIARERRILSGRIAGAITGGHNYSHEARSKGGKAKRKLTMDQAIRIKELRATGNYTINKLAEMYNVSSHPIRMIIKNYTYQEQ